MQTVTEALKEDEIDQIWNLGDKIFFMDPSLYRMDRFGNTIYRPSFGKRTMLGWFIEDGEPIAQYTKRSKTNIAVESTLEKAGLDS